MVIIMDNTHQVNKRQMNPTEQEWTIQRHGKHCEQDTERRQTKQKTQHGKLKR